MRYKNHGRREVLRCYGRHVGCTVHSLDKLKRVARNNEGLTHVEIEQALHAAAAADSSSDDDADGVRNEIRNMWGGMRMRLNQSNESNGVIGGGGGEGE
jgi:hypothetical protein